MNPQESQKLEMYILLCQCSHALITSLMNASKRCSPYVQVAIRQRMFQLAESLRLFLSGTPDRSLRAGGGHGSRLDRSLDVSRGSERGAASRHDVTQDDLNASVVSWGNQFVLLQFSSIAFETFIFCIVLYPCET